jgi:aspartate/methionine/tyrosine aminotransferase
VTSDQPEPTCSGAGIVPEALAAAIARLSAQGRRIKFLYTVPRRDAMLEALAAVMPAGCGWTKPRGGFFVWLRLPKGVDAKAMLPRAVAARVAYVPGTGFYADGSGNGYARLGYSLPEACRLTSACSRYVVAGGRRPGSRHLYRWLKVSARELLDAGHGPGRHASVG